MVSQFIKELSKFSTEQRRLIYDNVFAIELTQGCSVGCDFCCFSTTRNVENAIPFGDLEYIADEMGRLTDRTTTGQDSFAIGYSLNRLMLYQETDPLDYEHNGRNYFDVQNLFASKGFNVFSSTAIPKGKEELAVVNLEKIGRISISHMNRSRLKPYFDRLGVVIYIDVSNYYRGKFGRDWNYKVPVSRADSGQVKVVGSVEETVDRLRKSDPTLPRKTRFYDVRIDKNRRHEEVQDLDTLCLWCGRDQFPARDGRIIDRDESRVLNFGRAFYSGQYTFESWQDNTRPNICNVSGIKLTPKGVFNDTSVVPSKDCKTGRVTEKVSVDDFKILKLELVEQPLLFPRIPFQRFAELESMKL